MQKATEVMLELLRFSKNASIPAKYVLFDRWFTSPSSLHSVKAIGYEVIAMVRKSSNTILPLDYGYKCCVVDRR